MATQTANLTNFNTLARAGEYTSGGNSYKWINRTNAQTSNNVYANLSWSDASEVAQPGSVPIALTSQTVNYFVVTGLSSTVPAGATVLQLIQNLSTKTNSFSNLKNPTVMFFTALTALSFSAKNVLNYQLSTPGTFIANKLLPGDMLISPVTDGNLVQIYPLYKNNKPMVYGGYDKLSLKNSISNKLGNIYNSMSDAAFSINSMILEYSNMNSILNDQTQISTLKEVS